MLQVTVSLHNKDSGYGAPLPAWRQTYEAQIAVLQTFQGGVDPQRKREYSDTLREICNRMYD